MLGDDVSDSIHKRSAPSHDHRGERDTMTAPWYRVFRVVCFVCHVSKPRPGGEDVSLWVNSEIAGEG